MDNIFQKNRIRAIQLFEDGSNYFRKLYKQASEMFSYSTSYGQIMLVLKNLSNLVFYYQQDISTESNILEAKRTHNIYGRARLTGHNPSRGKSAIGEISLEIKQNNISVPGDIIYLFNHMRLKCKENGLTYTLELDNDDKPVSLKSSRSIRLKIIEGQYESQTFTGTGEDMQSFEVPMQAGKMIDDQKVYVTINGSLATKYDSLYDMEYGVLGCMVKTGYGSGIDVFFGKSIISKVPVLGSEIRVDYLVTNGSVGNFTEKENVTMEFTDSGFDYQGNDVDLNQLFNIAITLPPNFGSDFENPELTKLIAPYTSRNLIIHDEKSIYYHFSKMNFFSSIRVYRDNINDLNNYKVILIPNILNRMNSSEDYFSVDTSKFLLTKNEEIRLLNSIEESGNKSSNISISTVKPTIRRYVMYIFVDAFRKYNGKSVIELELRKQMKIALNKYLLTPRIKHNKLPHSDIVKEIDNIQAVDSVKVIFLSEQNELLAKQGTTDANAGFDEMGNIFVNDNELPIIRGGWSDRDGITYDDSFDSENNRMCAVNLKIKFID